MPLDKEAISQQQQLLATYRRTLAQLLNQAAQHGGEPFAPPAVANGIAEARGQIAQIKAGLRAHNVAVIDQHGDISPPIDSATASAPGAGAVPAVLNRGEQISAGVFVSGGTINGPVVGVNTGTITTQQSATAPPNQLEQALARVRHAADNARQRGDDDLADDLGGVIHSLQAALRAWGEGKAERQAAKLHEARDTIGRMAAGQPALRELAQMLVQIES
jgi:hypothetical protein